MWICPVCNNKIGNGFCCTSCHFDMSCNYEEYATLTNIVRSIGEPTKSINDYKKHYQRKKNPNVFVCDQCGGIYFLFSKEDGKLICADCGSNIPLPMMENIAENDTSPVSIEDEPYVITFDLDSYIIHSVDPFLRHGIKRYLASDFETAYQYFKDSANAGNIFAHAHLGIMLHYGEGCVQSDELAIAEFRKGAKAGCPLAASWLAECYRMGYGVEKDKEGGKKLLAKNADTLKEMCRQEDVSALYFLGFNLVMGIGVDVDEAEGVRLLTIAASKGDKSSAVQLAECYLYGWGVEVDAKKAVQLLTQNPLERNKKYHFLLARCYFNGDGIEKNLKKAFEEFKRAAEAGYGKAKDYLGDCYYHGYGTQVDYCKAANWYEDAANHHANADSAHSLACMYMKGQGVPKNKQTAFQYFQLAAREGIVSDQRLIAKEYITGDIVPKDYSEAKRWMEMAAKKGDAEAQFNLGLYYFSDDMGFNDSRKAFEWFSKSAEQGYAEAEYFVGGCYLEGIGVSTNYELANEWLEKALEHGCVSAAYELGINCLDGRGTTVDTARGIQLLETVADSKVDEARAACYELAKRYHSGIENFRGETFYENPSEAKWYAEKAAADETDGDAQFLMAEILNLKFDDTEAAAEWYRKAINNGKQEAKQKLNEMLAKKSKQDAAPKKKKHFWL